MGDADFQFDIGQRVRGDDGKVGLIKQLGRINGQPAYFVRGNNGGGGWYYQSELTPLMQTREGTDEASTRKNSP